MCFLTVRFCPVFIPLRVSTPQICLKLHILLLSAIVHIIYLYSITHIIMNIYLSKDVGSLIRDARKARKLNQQQLGNLVGVAQRRISVIENDPSKTELDMIIKICKALELRIDISHASQSVNTNKVNW